MAKQLKDGLILRTLQESPIEDRTKLAEFYRDTFEEIPELASSQILNWSNDLISESHPTTSLDDFLYVVDSTKDDAIVSAVMLIPQMWRYEDIPLPMGRIELVATHPDYRRRGLIRVLMDAAHERSAALGHVVQGITGISHYYRRFGYAFTVPMASGMGVNFSAMPGLNEGGSSAFTLRPAVTADIPLLVEWDRQYGDHCLLSTVRTDAMWDYELNQRNKNTPAGMYTYIIVDAQSDAVGYVSYVLNERFGFVSVVAYNVGEKTSILATFPDAIRAIKDKVNEGRTDPETTFERLGFDIGCHPTIANIIQRTSSGVVRELPHAWYLRVANLPGFIKLIKPVLERRLIGSGANNYTGELVISFYDFTGLIMRFENGKLINVEQKEIEEHEAQASFPFHSFLNVVFGHHDVDELRHILPEVSVSSTATILLNILFPKKHSWLMALG